MNFFFLVVSVLYFDTEFRSVRHYKNAYSIFFTAVFFLHYMIYCFTAVFSGSFHAVF